MNIYQQNNSVEDVAMQRRLTARPQILRPTLGLPSSGTFACWSFVCLARLSQTRYPSVTQLFILFRTTRRRCVVWLIVLAHLLLETG